MHFRTLCASVVLAMAAGGDVRAAARVFASLTSGAVSISHINSATGQQSHVYPTIPGVRYLAVSPGGREALFLADSTNLAGFVDLTTGALSPTIALTGTPAAAFFSQDGRTAFVIGSDLDQIGGADTYTLHLFAIDATTRAVSIDLKYPSLAGPQPCCNESAGFAVSPDGTKLYLPTTTAAADVIAIFALPSLTLSQTVTVGTSSSIFYPTTIAATSDGEYLVVGGTNQEYAPILTLYTTNTYQEVTSVAVPDPNEVQIRNLVASPTSDAVYAVVWVETTGNYVTTVSIPSLSLSAPLALTTDDSFEDMAVSPDGTKLLVGASILDLSSQTFQPLNSLSTLGVQGEFSDAGDLWIVNEDSTQIAVLEEGGDTVSRLISVGSQGEICPGRPGTIYFLSSSLDTIDTVTGTITANTQISSVEEPGFLAAGAGLVFIGAGFGDTLASYNPSTGQQEPISLPELGGGPSDIISMAASEGGLLFVGMYAESIGASSVVAVVDGSTGVLEGTFNVSPVGGMAVWDRTLFVATNSKEETATVTVIDLTGKTGARVLSVPAAGVGFSSLVVSPDGATLYGLSVFENLLAAIDISTGSLLATYSVNTYENTMALTPDGAKLYVSNQSSNDLTVIDTASGSMTTINVGSPTNFVAAR